MLLWKNLLEKCISLCTFHYKYDIIEFAQKNNLNAKVDCMNCRGDAE